MFMFQRKNGTMADSSLDDSTSPSTAAATITPKQALSSHSHAPCSTNSPSQPQRQPVQLQPPLALTATLLDVHQLDDYLLRLVLTKLQQVVHIYGSSDSTTDVSAASFKSKSSWLWPVLQLVTLWVTQGQTPAVRLLGLRVDTAQSAYAGDTPTRDDVTSSVTRNTSTRIGLLRYSVLGILIPYLYQKLKDWKTSVEMQQQHQQQQQQPQEISDGIMGGAGPTTQHQQERQKIARQRRLQVAHLLVRAVDTLLPGVKLVVLLACWSCTGGVGVGESDVCQPNNIAARLCQWKYHAAESQSQSTSTSQPPQHQQKRLHVDFAHRRWLYESLLHASRIWWAGLFLLAPVWQPDVQDYIAAPVTRLVRDMSSRVATAAATATAMVSFSPKTNAIGAVQEHQQRQCPSCPICRRADQSTNPVQGNCACRQIYCYACLYRAAVRSRKVYCRTCRKVITRCRFVQVAGELETAS
jgi:hypothetical protein